MLDFRGPISLASVPAASLDAAPRFSVATWVRVAHRVQPQVFVNRGARAELFTLYMYKGMVRMLVAAGGDTGGGYAFATAELPELNQWTHYAGTFDGTAIRIYRNGVLAGERTVSFTRPAASATEPLVLGAESMARSPLLGEMRDARYFARALTAAEVVAVRDGVFGSGLDLIAAAALVDTVPVRKADGFRGIWYSNQPSGDEYRFKYAGGFATYPQQHLPIAIHVPRARKTFFTYGAADGNNRLQHAVSFFDHVTGEVARPTILLDKHTADAHDNPVVSVDDAGHVWIFSPAHGQARPAFIHRSDAPYDVERFSRVAAGNFSYPQPWFVTGQGFCFLHTRYDGRRSLYCQTSPRGRKWSSPRLLASFGRGHYQVSWRHAARVGTVFNYHPREIGLNARTNLYYMETADGGRTFRTVRGAPVELPLREKHNPTLIAEYESKGLLVYLKDLQFDAGGQPVILYLTSRGYRAGPRNDPRTWRLRRFDGERWHDHEITTSDHNYDFGSLYLEARDRWRVMAPTAPGPQRYNTGGEIAVLESGDRGVTWRHVAQLTGNSEFNHTYLRRPVGAHPEFYGLWADGHGRQQSPSSLYFADRDGSVFRLPWRLTTDTAQPVRVVR